MELTKKQQEGLKIAIERYKNHEKFTVISGYAGTGKSTLVKFIVEALPDIEPELDVKYVAYTGKAANVLKNKGCPGATTAHKLIYEARMMPDGKYSFFPRQELEGHPLVIIVDEVSMLPKKMWDRLCSYNVYIIACGDPAQLPPVADKGEDPDNHVLDHPHIFLDEIMRQAAESEIIRLSMHVREGKSLSLYQAENKEIMMIPKGELTNDMLLWADEVLCSTNGTCGRLNNRMRQAKGLFGDPQVGDKIINRHNEWEFLSNKQNPLTNGIIGTVVGNNYKQDIYYPGWIRKEDHNFSIPVYWCDMAGDEEGEIFSGVMMDYEMINGREESLNGREKYLINRSKIKSFIPFTCTYGYAITTWKAQGSQWDKVLLMDEGWPYEPELRQKFLYTSITRAANKLVIIV